MEKAKIIKNGNINIELIKVDEKPKENFLKNLDTAIQNIKLPTRAESNKILAKSMELTFGVLMDNLCDAKLSDEEKAQILLSIKNICLSMKLKKPTWWYKIRNKINWMKEDGTLVYEEVDLGGF